MAVASTTGAVCGVNGAKSNTLKFSFSFQSISYNQLHLVDWAKQTKKNKSKKIEEEFLTIFWGSVLILRRAKTSASFLLSNPQSLATFRVQRLCTFNLHSIEKQNNPYYSHVHVLPLEFLSAVFFRTEVWFFLSLFKLPRHCIPWFHAPHRSDPQWSQKVNNRYVWATNRCGTFILNLFSRY